MPNDAEMLLQAAKIQLLSMEGRWGGSQEDLLALSVEGVPF